MKTIEEVLYEVEHNGLLLKRRWITRTRIEKFLCFPVHIPYDVYAVLAADSDETLFEVDELGYFVFAREYEVSTERYHTKKLIEETVKTAIEEHKDTLHRKILLEETENKGD
jgi:hypothetical protein